MKDDELQKNEEKVLFKKVKRKKIREKFNFDQSDSENEDEKGTLLECLEESREIRKLRRKHGGVSHESLLIGDQKNKDTKKDDDPYKTKGGGMLDMTMVKNIGKADDAYDTGIGSSFSVETNKRDEDAEMQKFIEDNLAKRKGLGQDQTEGESSVKYLAPEEAALLAVPEFLRKPSYKKNEEMLGNQMLNGIPEINLGLESKIKNIEATEEAKQRVLREAALRKNKSSTEQFIPKNMAVNFVQHSRYNIGTEDNQSKTKREYKKPQEVEQTVEPIVGGGVKISTKAPRNDQASKATDDFYYEKFRKNHRR